MRVELLKNLSVVVAILLTVNSVNSLALAQVGGTLRERIVEQRKAARSDSQELNYGSDPLQRLDYHVQRIDGTAQSNALAAALQKNGTPAEVKGFSGRGLAGHAEINRSLGDPDYPATRVVDDWLKKIFAK